MFFDTTLSFDNLREVPALARAAEAQGFDALWLSEIQHDPFLPAALIAEHTRRVLFGTAIAVSFARSPGTLAYTAWDLAQASGGRFVLGLGTQVKAHIEKRFGMPWPESPAGKLREQVEAIRALWHSWQTGEPLNHRGEYYRLTLMTPFFNPGPLPAGPLPAGPQAGGEIPIYLAGVNAGMARLSGETADGFHVHPFHTAAYLGDVLLPAIQSGEVGRKDGNRHTTINVTVFAASDAGEREFVRQQISFYASTPSYHSLMHYHGWEETAGQLSALAGRGRWSEMPAQITDDMLETFAVLAPAQELPRRLVERYAGLADRLSLYAPYIPGQRDALWQACIEAAHGA